MLKQNFELWSGKLPISDVLWTFSPEKEFIFSPKFHKEKNDHWRSLLQQFPRLYDGNLLFLDDFSIEEGRMALTTRSMKFSTLTYLTFKK